jgi:phage regulator Rha-like protein
MIIEQKLAKPVVTAKDSRATAASHDVAIFFGRSHNDVLRMIDNLLAIKPSLALGFYPDFQERALTQENPDTQVRQLIA